MNEWKKHDGSAQSPFTVNTLIEIETYTAGNREFQSDFVDWKLVKFYRQIPKKAEKPELRPLYSVDEFVRREVVNCVSGLMYAVGKDLYATAKLFNEDFDSMLDLYRAPDYENTALAAGWRMEHGRIVRVSTEVLDDEGEGETLYAASWKEACELDNLDLDYFEAYEHWIVSSWLAEKLKEYGEITGEFAGLTIWGRATTGQMISMDWVIQEIYNDVWRVNC